MALAETARLIASLELKDDLSKGIKSAEKSLGGLEKKFGSVGKGMATIGTGIGTAIRRGTMVAVAAAGGLIALLAQSVKEGQEVLKVDKLFKNAIRSSGTVTKEQTTALVRQQAALLELTGRDDELITQIQTRLIQMKATGKETLALTPLIVAAATATGKSTETVTMAVGKALQGNAGALGRIGIVLPKITAEQKKAITSNKKLTQAQKDAALAALSYDAVLAELTKRFGRVNDAMAGTLEIRLAVLREKMANIREEIGMKLLPSLTRIVDVVGKAVIPAFAKFVDRILPDISKGIDEFASALESGAAEDAINGIGDALGSVIDLLKIASAPVKAIVGAFMSLPKELQTVLIGGFAVNKLSGGLIGQGLGQILRGAIFERGGTPANPLFTADVTGGKGGVPGVAGKAAGIGTLGMAALAAEAVAAAAAVYVVHENIAAGLGVQATRIKGQTASFIGQATTAELRKSLDGLLAQQRDLNGDLLKSVASTIFPQGKDALADSISQLTAALDERGAKVAEARKELPIAPQRMSSNAEGVLQRAVEKGGKPSMSRLTDIMQKNWRATDALKAEQASKLAALGASFRQSAGDIIAAANRTTSAIAGKSFSPVVNVSTGFTITANISARDQVIAVRKRYSYVGGSTAGGQRPVS